MISRLKNPLLIFAIVLLVLAGIFECIQRVDNKKYDMKVTAVVFLFFAVGVFFMYIKAKKDW